MEKPENQFYSKNKNQQSPFKKSCTLKNQSEDSQDKPHAQLDSRQEEFEQLAKKLEQQLQRPSQSHFRNAESFKGEAQVQEVVKYFLERESIQLKNFCHF